MADYIGQRFGNYTLLRLLGHGGFASVYLGEHLYLKTYAAIKLLHTRLDGDHLESFLKEARTIASLLHPNIIRVLEFGVEGNIPFLVIDYASNGSLRHLYKRGERQPLPALLPYIKQVASALQYAHTRKMIHRDVKPENMLLNHAHEVLLSDFGIAIVAQSTRDQNPREVAGTIRYMAPEQIRGIPGTRSDQYALGIVVYEWLSGSPPFVGTYMELMTQHIYAAPPSLRERVPGLPPDVNEVVMIALRKEPERRFASISVFATALEHACQSSRSIILTSAPDSNASLSQLDVEPNPVPVSDQHRTEAITLPDLPDAERSPLPDLPTYKTNAGRMPRMPVSRRSVILGLAGVGSATIAGSLIWLLAQKEASSAKIIGTVLYTYTGHRDKVFAVAWSPDDGKRIASGSWDKTVHIWDAVDGSNVSMYHGHTKAVNSVTWSPDGKTLASSSLDGTVHVWDAKTMHMRFAYTGHARSVFQYGVSAVAWSRQNSIASAGDDKTVQLWTSDTGRHISTFKGHTAIVRCVSWSPDGLFIASGGLDNRVLVWNGLTGTIIASYKHASSVCSVAWSPDGKYIVSASDDRKVYVWQVEKVGHTEKANMPAQPLFSLNDASLYSPFSPLGDPNSRPTPEDDFYALGTNVFAVAWSPGGKHIASVDVGGYMLTWDALTSGLNYSIHNDDFRFINAVAWAPDGTRIATGNDSAQVQVWQEEQKG